MDRAALASFGDLLKQHRDAAGLTQAELAERAGLSVRGISDLERGFRRLPQRGTLELLARALDLSAPEQARFTAAARLSAIVQRVPPTPGRPGRPRRHVQELPSLAELPRDAYAAWPLIGRAQELALLERHLAGDGPPLLLLAGEPGIGKSRLLHAAASGGPGYGLRVLEGGCQRRGGHDPYAPLLGALRRHIREQRPAQLREDLRGCAWLVKLLPEMAAGPSGPLPAWTLSPEQERRLMVEAVTRFLANVGGPSGTLLILDDLQWAGSDALELLATLARSAAEAPLRIIGAYRDTEVRTQDALSITLADLTHAGLAARRLLRPLASQEAARLLDELLAGSDDAGTVPREEIVRRTGGVPFFVVSYARELPLLRDKGDGASRNTGERVGPWAVAQSVRQRVAALPEGTQTLLGAAAVVGRVIPHTLLGSVTGQPETEVFMALGTACRAGLLEEGDQTYQFTHDVIHEVIEHDLGIARRAVLHRRVAEALEERPGECPVELLAYHYGRSAEQDKAALYLEQAGDRANARHAHAAARDYYREAIDRLEGLGRARDVARVREELGVVLKRMDLHDQALSTLERVVLFHHQAGDLDAEGRVTAVIGEVYFAAGIWEEGIARVQPLLMALEACGPSSALAALYIALIPLFAPTGRYRDYLAAAERASALSRIVKDDRLLAASEKWRGIALAELDRRQEARPVLEGAVPLAEAVNDLSSLGTALAFLGGIYLAEGAFEQARVLRERALAAFEQWGEAQPVAWATSRLADVHTLLGNWIEARALYQRAIGIMGSLGWAGRHAALPLVSLGELALREGQWEEASRHLAEGAALAERISHLGTLRRAQIALAEQELFKGQPQAALARLKSPHQCLTLDESILTVPIPALATVYLALGRRAEAENLVTVGITRARDRHDRVGLLEWLRLQALVTVG